MHIDRRTQQTNKQNKQMTSLEKLNNHPCVQNIEVEFEFGKKTYWINLKQGFAKNDGSTCGREDNLNDVKKFLADVSSAIA
jgi:hypothetical protein